MKTGKQIGHFLLLCIACLPGAYAQFDNLRVERLNTKYGMPNGSINHAEEDRYGFLWFATNEGVFRYDGYEFKAYHHDLLDSTTLSHPGARCVYEDREGDIWVGTTYGLNGLDRRTGRFQRFLSNPEDGKKTKVNNIVWKVFEDSRGNFWVIASRGLFLFDRQLRRFVRPSLGNLQESGHVLEDIFESTTGQLWAGTEKGLLLLTPEKESYRHVLPDPDPESPYNLNIQKIVEDEEGSLWLATEGGLAKWNPRTAIRTAVFLPPDLRSVAVRHLVKDHRGNLWIVFRGAGIGIYDMQRKQFRHLTYQADQYNSLNNDNVQYLLEDQFHNIWACTINGLCKIRVDESGFTLLQNEGGFDNLSNHVQRVLQTKEGAIWSSTPRGMFQIEKGQTQGRKVSFPSESGEVLGDWILEDPDGGIWVSGRNTGLHHCPPGATAFRTMLLGDSLQQALIYKMVNDAAQEDIIWLGTSFGLCRLNRRTLQRTWYIPSRDIPVLPSDKISIFDQYGSDEIWLYYTYFNSLGRFDKRTGKFELVRPGPEEQAVLEGDLKDIAIGADGNIWLATLFGLTNFNIPSQTFRIYTKKDGLPENELNTVILDKNGRLWICGNRFLAYHDYQGGVFKSYLIAKEVKNFLSKSRYVAEDGRLFLGSINGIYTFHPGEVRENRQLPHLVLTDFKVNDQSYSLPQPFEETTDILLGHDENNVTFDFSAIHLVNPEANEYRCKLEGFNNQWRRLGREHKVSYTNLLPGSYVFRVAAANSDGVWNEEGLRIGLVIAPAYWQTTWFQALIIMVMVSIGLAIYKNRQHQAGLRREKEQAERSAAEKTRFLANVSHEIRTPMNAIIGLSKLLGETTLDDRQHKFVNAVYRSSKNLLSIINDLLDHTRLEAGQFNFVQKSFRLDQVTGLLEDTFSAQASEKQLELAIRIDPGIPPGLVGDPVRLSQILTNLLGNALKFTASGKAWLTIRKVRQDTDRVQLHFEVGDTGPGIPPDKVDSIFEVFSQVEAAHAAEGTGLGLAIARQLVERQGGQLEVESEPGKGTVLWFDLWFGMGAATATPREAPATAGYAFDGLRVLVVEDTPFNQLLAVELLKKYIREPVIAVAENGQAALDMLSADAFDLILLDVKMPVMDGYEAARRIRAQQSEPLRRIPILGVTASAVPEQLRKALEAGMDDCVTKPIDSRELLEKMHWLLKKKYHDRPDEAESPAG